MLLTLNIMKHIFFITIFSILLFSVNIFANNDNDKSKIGMLILGSDDLKTLEDRVAVGYQLYRSDISFDYIIVSGGCGAHGSSICEASEMFNLLAEKGVPKEKIFKEEKSKNTVQNYTYSRLLRNSDGSKLIQAGDSLYVVSNHWHAISVAARFTTYDEVNAIYHIEGNIKPSTKDKVDYVNIFHGNTDNADFCAKALWPVIGASFYFPTHNEAEEHPATFCAIIGDTIIAATTNDLGQLLPISPDFELKKEHFDNLITDVDAAFYNEIDEQVYLFQGAEYLSFHIHKGRVVHSGLKPITQWAPNLPTEWKTGYWDAAYFDSSSRSIVIFKNDNYLLLAGKSLKVKKGYPKQITQMVTNWPQEWGSGDIDAAQFSRVEKKIYLFRGKEFLKIDDGRVEDGYPKPIGLKYPKPAS